MTTPQRQPTRLEAIRYCFENGGCIQTPDAWWLLDQAALVNVLGSIALRLLCGFGDRVTDEERRQVFALMAAQHPQPPADIYQELQRLSEPT